MDFVTLRQIKEALINASNLIVQNEEYLTKLDSVIGDGDHGIGMKSGFSTLAQFLQNDDYKDIAELFVASGVTVLRVMGGASGVIFGTLFISGHDVAKGKTTLNAEELVSLFEQSAEAIMRRGHSRPGDKTMLDALVPAIEAMKLSLRSTKDVAEVLESGYRGAEEGAASTEKMLPKKGRSKNFREGALGVADPGAVSVSILFKGISEHFRKIKDIEGDDYGY